MSVSGEIERVQPFAFNTTPESLVYCLSICQEMTRLFGISEAEAIRRMNQRWHHVGFVTPDEINNLTHDVPDYWAKDIYYGHESMWWRDEVNCKPLPCP